MRDKSKVVRTALRAAKRRRYDIGGIADPYGMMETEEELRKKNPLYQNTGDLGFLNPHPYDPATDPTTLGTNTNAGQLGTGLPNGFGGALTPTGPKGNDLVPYDNSNYQPGAVQTFGLPTNDFVAYNNANYQPGAVQSFSLAPPSSTALTSTPAQVAALNVATNPNQMFTDSGKITSHFNEPLPGYLGPLQQAFVDESKAAMAAYGNLADTFAANQTATPTAAEVDQSLPGAVAGANLAGTFDPMASQDVLGDVSHGAFGLSGPMGLSNAMQETNEQVDAQEAEQAAAEQAAAEQAAAAETENAGSETENGGPEEGGGAPEGGGGGAPEGGGGGPDEKRGGRIHMRHKYDVDYPLDKDRDNKLTYMKPKEFLKKARPLNMDKDDKKDIKGFKHSIENGHKLDPLALYPHNRENGRHRAVAAKELGIKEVPVHNYRKEAHGGSIVDKALMLTSRRLSAAKAPK